MEVYVTFISTIHQPSRFLSLLLNQILIMFSATSRRINKLEQENARLLVLAQNRSLPEPQQAQSDEGHDSEVLVSTEVEQLLAKIAAHEAYLATVPACARPYIL
jgi:hypothetical protein